ncbi:MAG: isoprenylcysteine carboxylmethyltransferase family protein [Rhizobiaceae bacterium]|nr:isoprenylcysteine carboxylmethyltransferase family protein [Rhizobiaceae bacterium]
MRLLIPPPLQAIICAGLMWVSSQFLPSVSYTSEWSLYLAAGLVLIGICIDFSALAGFFKSKTTVSPVSPSKTTSLVVTGIYQYTRNPMYLGLAFILSGFAIWLGNAVSLVFVPLFIWYVTRFQIIPEEEVLLEKFGMQYADYVSKVRRWI